MERVGGTISFKIDGIIYRAKGNFTYNLGRPKRETIVGSDDIHGYKEMPQVGFIEGVITDSAEISAEALLDAADVTTTLELANGKIISCRESVQSNEGNITTEEGEIAIRMEGKVEEIR